MATNGGAHGGGSFAALLIASMEMVERFSVAGVSMDLGIFLVDKFHLGGSTSTNVVKFFHLLIHLFALGGGHVADARIGRFRTIIVSSALITLGLFVLSVDATVPGLWPPTGAQATGGQMAVLYLALAATAAGAGGLKASVSAFGADQYNGSEPREDLDMMFYLNRFFFFSSLGTVLGSTVLLYVERTAGRGLGYAVAATTILVAAAVIVATNRRYRHRPPSVRPLSMVRRVLWKSFKNRNQPHPPMQVNRINRLRFLEKASLVLDDSETIPTTSDVEDVKKIILQIPIWVTSVIFWVLHERLSLLTLRQSGKMERRVKMGSLELKVPIRYILGTTTVGTLIITSLNGAMVAPISRRLTKYQAGMSCLQRAGTGLFTAILALATAAAVEKGRMLNATRSTNTTVLLLLPQLLLLGAAVGFFNVGLLQFCVREAPKSMISTSIAFFLASSSLGFKAGESIFEHLSWTGSEANLSKFYILLAVIGGANFALFVIVAKKHVYRTNGQG